MVCHRCGVRAFEGAGDPTFLFISEYTTDEVIAEWRKEFGLDRPYPIQYLSWLSTAIRGDFGASLNEAGRQST